MIVFHSIVNHQNIYVVQTEVRDKASLTLANSLQTQVSQPPPPPLCIYPNNHIKTITGTQDMNLQIKLSIDKYQPGFDTFLEGFVLNIIS